MRAYSFLDTEACSIFTGIRWPVPEASRPGAWVDGHAVRPRGAGVHACRAEHLAYWINAELWEIQLDGAIRVFPHHVVAERGRLIRRCPEWQDELASDLGKWCAGRVRDLAVEAARQDGHHEVEQMLVGCAALGDLAALEAAIEAAGDTGSHQLAALAVDAAAFAQAGPPMEAPFIAARAAAFDALRRCADEDAAFAAERDAQSAWIAARLARAD